MERLEVTETQFMALERMCNSQLDGKFSTDIYTIAKLGNHIYQLQLGENSDGIGQVCGIERGTKLPMSIQAILRQLYNRYSLQTTPRGN